MPRRRGLPWNKRGMWKVRTLAVLHIMRLAHYPVCTLSRFKPSTCSISFSEPHESHCPTPINHQRRRHPPPRASAPAPDLQSLTYYFRNTVTTKYDIQPALPAHVAIDLPAAIKSRRTELITRVLPITVAASDAIVTKRLKLNVWYRPEHCPDTPHGRRPSDSVCA